MAQLPPDGQYLVQQIGADVVIFERYTEREIARFDPADQDATAQAQKVIHDSPDLTAEQKNFAHFWSGYFYGSCRRSACSCAAGGTAARYANLGVTDDQVASGDDFGRYDFPNLGSPGPDRDSHREW